MESCDEAMCLRSQFLYLSLPPSPPPPTQVQMIVNVLCGQTMNKNDNNKKARFFFFSSKLVKGTVGDTVTKENCKEKQGKRKQ